MPTYPLTTLAPQVTPTGIEAPTYVDVLESLKASARLIYGSDAYLEADSQDGQLLALVALAIYDCGQAAVAAYNAYSPQTAVGVGLSNAVKINDIARLVATHSQVNVAIGGVAGTTITAGVVGDSSGNRWNLPGTVTIPGPGTITVTATAADPGAINAVAHAVTAILTPTAGWQTVDNAAAATPGQPVESDAELRARQANSPSLLSRTPIAALAAALQALPGVTYGVIYENDTASTDSNGVPAHTIAVVIAGGVAADVAATIYAKKSPGVSTHGSTTVSVTDAAGLPRDIKFSVPTGKACKVGVTLHADAGYTTAIANEVKAAIAAAINALAVGEDVVVARLYVPAMLDGAADSLTYRVTLVEAAYLAGALGTTDLVIGITEKATCTTGDVAITVI